MVKLKSKKSFYVVAIAVCLLWIIQSMLPGNFEEERFGPAQTFHMRIYEGMSSAQNILAMILQIACIFGSAYVIFVASVLLKRDK